MSSLKKEYTDIKDKTHKVVHLVAAAEDKDRKEQVVEELLNALSGSGKRIPA